MWTLKTTSYGISMITPAPPYQARDWNRRVLSSPVLIVHSP
jgi:hypothetical protein